MKRPNVNQYFPKDSSSRLNELIGRYERNKRSIPIDFRKEVNWISGTNRVTHQIHSYPAKLLVHIPHFFLANDLLSKPGDTILDPFCGSGTVLLEGTLAGRKTLGADANPLARLITKVKVTPIDKKRLHASYLALENRIKTKPTKQHPEIVNAKHWFTPDVLRQLQCINEGIEKTRNTDIRDFFQICFSQTIRKVSLADPRLSVPVKLHPSKYPEKHPLRLKMEHHLESIKQINVLNVFSSITKNNIEKISKLQIQNTRANSLIIYEDARALTHEMSSSVKSDSIQLVMTSPPYSGAQKYIRASSLSLNWLNLVHAKNLSKANSQIIGREDFQKNDYALLPKTGIKKADNLLMNISKINALRAYICAKYLLEMSDAVNESMRVLKSGGFFVLIAGNNKVCGMDFYTVDYLKELLLRHNTKLRLSLIDTIRSRGLMTRRNKTASMITREWVLVFQKA